MKNFISRVSEWKLKGPIQEVVLDVSFTNINFLAVIKKFRILQVNV